MTHLIFKEIWKFSACFVFLRNFGSSFVSSNYLTQNQVMAKLTNFRSSRREVFCKKGVLRNFTKFIGKHLYQSLSFNKVAGQSLFIKKETLVQVFSCELCEISENTFFDRTRLVATSTIFLLSLFLCMFSKVFTLRCAIKNCSENLLKLNGVLLQLDHLLSRERDLRFTSRFLPTIAEKGVFVFPGPRPWLPICITGPGPRFVFTGSGPQFVFNSPGPEYVFTCPGSKFVFSGPGPNFVFTGPGL